MEIIVFNKILFILVFQSNKGWHQRIEKKNKVIGRKLKQRGKGPTIDMRNIYRWKNK